MSTGFVKALGRIGHMIPQYEMCLEADLYFESTSGGTNSLSAGSVSGIGFISSYIIEWHQNSPTGTTVLLSGYNPNETVDVLHPFVDYEIYDGGDLYAVFRYIIIDGIKYSPYYRVGQWSPDLTFCLGYVTVYNPPEIDCLDGLNIETTYLHTSTDLTLLPSGYTNPCSVGGHTCARAFYEVYGNGIYMGDSKLNNTSTPLTGCQSLSGAYICGDYHNFPDAFTYPNTWLASGGSTYARYNKITLTREQAIAIANAGSGTTISLTILPGMITYSCACGSTSPHSNVTWTRVTNSKGEVLWNSCITGNNVTLIDVCTTGSTTGVTTTTTTLPPTTTTTTTCIGVDCHNVFEEYGGGIILNISGNTALIVMKQSDWSSGSAGFSNWDDVMASASALTFSGYTDWRLPTVDEWYLIGYVTGAASQVGWNQFSYYWTYNDIDGTYAYRWRTSDDSCSTYGEAYNLESVDFKSSSGLYGIAVRYEYF